MLHSLKSELKWYQFHANRRLRSWDVWNPIFDQWEMSYGYLSKCSSEKVEQYVFQSKSGVENSIVITKKWSEIVIGNIRTNHLFKVLEFLVFQHYFAEMSFLCYVAQPMLYRLKSGSKWYQFDENHSLHWFV